MVGAGIWQRDPDAALGRVQALSARAGSGLSSFQFDRVSLLVRCEGEVTAALFLGPGLDNETAHDLLKALWGAGQRLKAAGPSTEARN